MYDEKILLGQVEFPPPKTEPEPIMSILEQDVWRSYGSLVFATPLVGEFAETEVPDTDEDIEALGMKLHEACEKHIQTYNAYIQNKLLSSGDKAADIAAARATEAYDKASMVVIRAYKRLNLARSAR